jgi:hypothetical protein
MSESGHQTQEQQVILRNYFIFLNQIFLVFYFEKKGKWYTLNFQYSDSFVLEE